MLMTTEAQAKALVEALLAEVVLRATDSIELPPFRKQLYNIKHSNKMLFDAIVKKYKRWRANPESLNFEPKHSGLYAVELPSGYHAVCSFVGGKVLWEMIGVYMAYSRYLDKRR